MCNEINTFSTGFYTFSLQAGNGTNAFPTNGTITGWFPDRHDHRVGWTGRDRQEPDVPHDGSTGMPSSMYGGIGQRLRSGVLGYRTQGAVADPFKL